MTKTTYHKKTDNSGGGLATRHVEYGNRQEGFMKSITGGTEFDATVKENGKELLSEEFFDVHTRGEEIDQNEYEAL